jgi:hypothetical protein
MPPEEKDNPFAAAMAEVLGSEDAGTPEPDHSEPASGLSTPDAKDPMLSLKSKPKEKPAALRGLDQDKPREGAWQDAARGLLHSVTGGTYVNKLFDQGVDTLNRGARAVGLPSADHTLDGKPARYAGATPSQTLREKPVQKARENHPEMTAAGEGAGIAGLIAVAPEVLGGLGVAGAELAPIVKTLAKPVVAAAEDVASAIPVVGKHAAKLRPAVVAGAKKVADAATRAGAGVHKWVEDAKEAVPNIAKGVEAVSRGAQGLATSALARGGQIEGELEDRYARVIDEFKQHPWETALTAVGPAVVGAVGGGALANRGAKLKDRADETFGKLLSDRRTERKALKKGGAVEFRRMGKLAREMGLDKPTSQPGSGWHRRTNYRDIDQNLQQQREALGNEVARTNENVFGSSTGRDRPDAPGVNERVGDVELPTAPISAKLNNAAQRFEVANAPEKAAAVRRYQDKFQPQPTGSLGPPAPGVVAEGAPRINAADDVLPPGVMAPPPAPPAPPGALTIPVTAINPDLRGGPVVRENIPPAAAKAYSQPPQPTGVATPGVSPSVAPTNPQRAPTPYGVGTPTHHVQPGPAPVGPFPSRTGVGTPGNPQRNAPAPTEPATPAGYNPPPDPHPAPPPGSTAAQIAAWEEEQELLKHNLGVLPETPAGQFPGPKPAPAPTKLPNFSKPPAARPTQQPSAARAPLPTGKIPAHSKGTVKRPEPENKPGRPEIPPRNTRAPMPTQKRKKPTKREQLLGPERAGEPFPPYVPGSSPQYKLAEPKLELGGPAFQEGAPRAPRINLSPNEQRGADPSRLTFGPRPMTGIAQPTPDPVGQHGPWKASPSPAVGLLQNSLRPPDPILTPKGGRGVMPRLNLMEPKLGTLKGQLAPLQGPYVPMAGLGPHPQPAAGFYPQPEFPTPGPMGLNPPVSSGHYPTAGTRSYLLQQGQELPPSTQAQRPQRQGPRLDVPHFSMRQADEVQRDMMSQLRDHAKRNNVPLKPGEDKAVRPIAYGLAGQKHKTLDELEAGGNLIPELLKEYKSANSKFSLMKDIEDHVGRKALQEPKYGDALGTTTITGLGLKGLHRMIGDQKAQHRRGRVYEGVGEAVQNPRTRLGITGGVSGYQGSHEVRSANEDMKKEIEKELNGTIK